MAKRFMFLLLSIITVMSTVNAMETKLSMELWNRHTITMENSEITKNSFSLERGYFRLEPVFNDKVKGRFNLDFFSSDKFTDGVGIKLKYAYLDFSLPIEDAKFSVGLIKNFFGTIYDWDYTTIQKNIDDASKTVSSTDYGAAFNGLFPKGFGEYSIHMMNGEGYKKTGSNVDVNPSFGANIRLIPLTGITIGGSVYYTDATLLDTTAVSDTVKFHYAAVGKLSFGPVSVLGEYLVKTVDGLKASGYMVQPVFYLSRIIPFDMDIVGRYDAWDPDNSTANDGHSIVTGGFNYNLQRDEKNKPVLFVQANFERTMYENGSNPVDNVMLQLRWIFSSKIN